MSRALRSFSLSFLFLAAAACAASPDNARKEAASPPAVDDCPAADAEATCMAGGAAACCYEASIKYEYEMLDARQKGDEAAAQPFEARYLDLVTRACDGKHEQACKDLAARAK
ncbi:hypothetical protein [Nannocystis sp. SCPEA4]|uniref:hypothetical protein n=1 Tax=Nannocystis sp. SCPEA4 TaxID=2996787 RepID=UPI00226F2B44|nr:hypothetical protein [Nannocystis sp. SCPEA4]MCY1059946.1 hypothetical protein [Nannocystis sp. SCPEA4]